MSTPPKEKQKDQLGGMLNQPDVSPLSAGPPVTEGSGDVAHSTIRRSSRHLVPRRQTRACILASVFVCLFVCVCLRAL